MRRKIFICFFVVLLMTTLVVPAFAAPDLGESTIDTIQPSFVIDYIEFVNGSSAGSVASWPNNFGSDAVEDSVSFPFTAFLCSRYNVSSSSGTYRTSVLVRDTTSFNLYLSNVLLLNDLSFILSANDAAHLAINNLKISGCYSLPYVDNDNEYRFSHNYCEKVFTIRSWSVDLYSYICETFFLSPDFYFPAAGVWVHDLVISFDISTFDLDPDAFCFFDVDVSCSPVSNDIVYWFDSSFLEQVYSPSGGSGSSGSSSSGDMFDWLISSVNAFMDFEFVPNLSLNEIFLFILIIGLLLWFVKLMA